LNRFHEFFCAAQFENVTRGAGPEGLFDEGKIGMHAEKQKSGGTRFFAKNSRCVDAIKVGHRDIGDNHVGTALSCHFNHRATIARDSYNLKLLPDEVD
jgi:hypothetical protein